MQQQRQLRTLKIVKEGFRTQETQKTKQSLEIAWHFMKRVSLNKKGGGQTVTLNLSVPFQKRGRRRRMALKGMDSCTLRVMCGRHGNLVDLEDSLALSLLNHLRYSLSTTKAVS